MPSEWTVSYTIWFGAVVFFGVATLIAILKYFLIGNKRGSAVDAMSTVYVLCVSCGWKGEVPRLRKRCPMCGGSNFG